MLQSNTSLIQGAKFDPMGDYTQGATDGQKLAAFARADQARPLEGAALTGNADALKQLAGVDPGSYINVQKAITTQDASAGKAAADHLDQISGLLNWADTPDKWNQAMAHLDQQGIPVDPHERDFSNRPMLLSQATTLSDQMKAQQSAASKVPQGYTQSADGTSQHFITGGPADPAQVQALETAKGAAKGAAPGNDDVKMIVQGIVNGDQPPLMTGLYKNSLAVKAELERQGFPLAKANLDWQATTKSLASLNSNQQNRLRQSVQMAQDILPSIEDMAKQWKGGGFPILNKAQLALAKNGAMGPEAQSLATRLDSQIATLTSDLGAAYMGGNSPTDHALGLAAKVLQSDWSEKTLLDSIQMARDNLKIRQNSLSLPPAGVDNSTNRYAPQSGTGGSGGQGQVPSWVQPFAAQGAKQAPDGNWYMPDSQRPGKFVQIQPDNAQ